MVRPTQLLYPQRAPAVPRPAATVLLLRDGPDGPEVLMTRRSMTASFAPGAYFFPGGGIDTADAQAHTQAARRPSQTDLRLTQAIAAIRESFEELGILLARRVNTGADGQAGTFATDADIARLDRKAPFFAQCAAHGLQLAADGVFVLAHWVTDRDLGRRFDVPFLVARMPEGQTPVADESEQFEPVWVRPSDALARHEAGQFFIIYPTIRTLERLKAFATVDAVLQACAPQAGLTGGVEQPLWTACPRAGRYEGNDEARFMEHESAYGELALTCPDGQIVHTLDWQSERPVKLLANVMRLTAPNPSAMTGPGTNSYIVGDAATGYIVIDPGPNDAAHVQRLWQATGGDIRMIVCTHSHADHSPGARPLQLLCEQTIQAGIAENAAGIPPILGLPSAPTARAGSQFTPDRALQNGELLSLINNAESGIQDDKISAGHTLQVIHTPGHAANHLCLVLQEDGLLFSGDHVLNGSTTVVDPPDGNMNDYLDSLDRLADACDAHRIDFILPAHGWVLGDLRHSSGEVLGAVSGAASGDGSTNLNVNPNAPEGGAKKVITQLKAHRLKREAKVAAALQALPEGTMDDWVAQVYNDVSPRLWPIAKRSLLAHVERIRALAAA
jgi:recombination protein RecT